MTSSRGSVKLAAELIQAVRIVYIYMEAGNQFDWHPIWILLNEY